MLSLAGSAQRTMYFSVSRPSSELIRPTPSARPLIDFKPLIDLRPLIDFKPLVLLKPLIDLSPFVLSSACSTLATESSPCSTSGSPSPSPSAAQPAIHRLAPTASAPHNFAPLNRFACNVLLREP